MYLILSTFPTLCTDVCHEFTGIGGLNYILLGLGAFVDAYLCDDLNDRPFQRRKARNHDESKPEYRVFAIGNMITLQIMQTYIGDTYTKYAASAIAAV
ncbi:MFS multidrug transporter [Apiospora kogelbergensis]|uniref:MFS multidrug transporter n=1 Tax=Apiospora kogelbergensis TaxID=1337665 RepID=UPI00312DB44A